MRQSVERPRVEVENVRATDCPAYNDAVRVLQERKLEHVVEVVARMWEIEPFLRAECDSLNFLPRFGWERVQVDCLIQISYRKQPAISRGRCRPASNLISPDNLVAFLDSTYIRDDA